MPDLSSRRPLASRNTAWAGRAAEWLVEARVSPNRISMASMGFALIGFLLFWGAGHAGPWLRGLALILAAAACQLRLLCNLLDGMVAVEGGKGTASGPFWNEAPDRVADLLLLGGAGLAVGSPGLGFLAGGLAVFTAHLRELGRAEGLGADFSGPMAKPHRMALLTGGSVLAAFEPIVHTPPVLLTWALWLIVAGTAVTILRRSRHLLAGLNRR